MISSYLPYPLTNGGHIRLFNLLKKLASKHEVTLICEKRPHQTQNDIDAINKICKKVITVPRKKQWSMSTVLKAGFSFNSFLVAGHTNNKLKESIAQSLINEQFDLIHVETFYVTQNIPDTNVPIVITEHNIEYLVYARYSQKAPFLIRPLLYLDVYKLKLNEEKAWDRAQSLIAVSIEEKQLMKKSNVNVVPNGVDLDSFNFKNPVQKQYHSVARHLSLPQKEILFIGDFKWIQNRDTIAWILKDIWPYLLRAVESEVKIYLRIVGKNIPGNLKKLNTFDSVIFDENAPNETAEIFKKSDILLAPIRVGGGTSYKILEAMASGIPVVTTFRGMRGLEVQQNKHLYVSDDVQGIVDKTARLLRDTEEYEKIAHNARKLIEEKYDWNVIVHKLNEVYESVRNNSKQ